MRGMPGGLTVPDRRARGLPRAAWELNSFGNAGPIDKECGPAASPKEQSRTPLRQLVGTMLSFTSYTLLDQSETDGSARASHVHTAPAETAHPWSIGPTSVRSWPKTTGKHTRGWGDSSRRRTRGALVGTCGRGNGVRRRLESGYRSDSCKVTRFQGNF